MCQHLASTTSILLWAVGDTSIMCSVISCTTGWKPAYSQGKVNVKCMSTGKSHIISGLHSWKMLCKSNTKFPLSWGLEDWQPHPKYCMIILLGDIWTCRVHMYFIYSIYTGHGKNNRNTWQYRNKTACVGCTERTSVVDICHHSLVCLC